MGMRKSKSLDYKLLRKKLQVSELDFENTEEIKALTEFVGQERALASLNFGIRVKSYGYNLYAMGPSGIGKRSLVNSVLEEKAAGDPVPSDWCYIYNFEAPEKPIPLELPAGKGIALQQDMKSLIDELATTILTVYESDEYRTGMKKINDQYNSKRSRSRKRHAKSKIDNTPKIYKEQHKKEKDFLLSLINAAVDPAITKIKKKYAKLTDVENYLIVVQKDILENISDFVKHDEKTNLFTFSLENPALMRYKVNVLVDNSKLKGAPVIFEESPTYSTLITRVEHTTHEGSLTTNFTLIKPGGLHLANGGYLIIEARKLKKNHEAWEALKSALYSRKITLKPFEHQTDQIKPVSLEPLSIPLDVKIILLGSRALYYSLTQKDPDFTELFKVPVDFDEEILRTPNNVKLYARLVGTIAKKKNLRPLHASGVAAIIEHSSRLAEDIEKLSTHVSSIEDIIIESDHWASTTNKKYIDAEDVIRAIDEKTKRMDRSRELYYEYIYRDFIIINTEDKLIGHVNCLSVRKVGEFSYGHPTRVTARVRSGQGKLIDIQREIKMAGPLHAKAGLTISTYLASRFNLQDYFSLHASIAFEQIYCWTEGDSASIGEVCAILSALAEVPILQNLAVTGSIDQYGDAQAIGGVNEKIEGFFDVCKICGFTNNQGVIIPKVNEKNLMLKEEIVLAAKAKKFFIYSISNVDEAMHLLTGIHPGERDRKTGHFPKDSTYYKVEEKLTLFSKISRSPSRK